MVLHRARLPPQRLDGEGAFDTAGAAATEATSVNSIRGIAGRPIIGYLSHVEAMRYSRVGDFLKTPLVPIWLVRRERVRMAEEC